MSSISYLAPLLGEYLKCFDIEANRSDLQLVLQSSPSFPSVLSVIQACTYFGLEATAYKGDYDALLKSEMPAIVHLKEDSDETFVLVKKVTDKCVTYKDTTTRKTIETTPDKFCKQWTGILILSKKSEENRHAKNKFPTKKLGMYGLLLFALLTVFLHNAEGASSFTFSLFLLKCVGIWITYNLIRHEKGASSYLFDDFCRMKASFDCDKVLASRASKIFNTVSLADGGFVYFVTGLSALVLSVFSGFQRDILLIIFYVSVCGIPFILFSVLYQKIVVKKWCPLCLSVAGVVLLEICLFLLYPDKFSTYNYSQPLILLFFSLIISVLILHFLKRLLQAQTEAFTNKIESLKVKRDPLVLMTIFNRQQHTTIPQNHQIIVGSKQSPIVITTLLNPMCQPCAKMVKDIIALMETHPQTFLWQIRFDGIETKEYHSLNHVQLCLMELCTNETDNDLKLQIIKEWYDKQSVRWFTKKYAVKEIAKETIIRFAEQNAENKLLNVKRVPTTWINNKELPLEYSMTDISFLCTDLNLLLKLTK